MPRFFASYADIGDGEILIKGKDAFHIARSLRMAVGDSLVVSDGEGQDYSCTLARIRDDECVATIIEVAPSKRESPVAVTLYMAIPKGDKLEVVVQKAVELGASDIVPFESERCIKRPSGDRAEKLVERLNKIAHEAAKQCGRAVLPRVHGIVKLSEVVRQLPDFDLSLFCYEGEGTVPVRSVLEGCEGVKTVSAIVGSEGGFSAAEAELICSGGAKCVGLGPRILRCETAPEYVLSAISYRFEM